MGIRNRTAEKKNRRLLIQKNSENDKRFSRAKAEHALSNGADPTEERFTEHSNYHVRRRSWVLQGRPLPESTEDQNKFLATLQGVEVPKDPKDLPAFYQGVRARVLKEAPPAEVVVEDAAAS